MLPDTFSTDRLFLRPIRLDDARAIFDGYAQDSEVTRFLSWTPRTSIDQSEDYVRTCMRSEASRVYMLVERGMDPAIGALDLRPVGMGRLEFGYVLARPYWGRGLMTEVLSEVVSWAMRQPTFWRIGAFADVENLASIRVMEKAGLEREGVLKRWLVHPNVSAEPRDCVVMARTR